MPGRVVELHISVELLAALTSGDAGTLQAAHTRWAPVLADITTQYANRAGAGKPRQIRPGVFEWNQSPRPHPSHPSRTTQPTSTTDPAARAVDAVSTSNAGDPPGWRSGPAAVLTQVD